MQTNNEDISDVAFKHKHVLNKSQVPAAKQKKESFISELKNDLQQNYGVAMTEGQIMKKGNNMKTLASLILYCKIGNLCFTCPKHLSMITLSLVSKLLNARCCGLLGVLKGVISQGAIPNPESPRRRART
nr:unnamed protein product [Callosobruchus chinensis]